ncbi:MAG: gliding motility-associated ABC transporter substrate-binding protein GldG [Bacteroidota bacterium]
MKEIKRNTKRNNLVQLLMSFVIIILINVIGYFVFTRFDLTSEKRYTLSENTRNSLENLNDVVYFKVYLEGEFPSGFKRLHNETREMLEEFRAYSTNIQYEFINPSANPDKKEMNALYQQLVQKGLQPTNLQTKNKGGSSQQIIFPGAIVSYQGREVALPLLVTQLGLAAEAQLNNSIQALEYNLVSAIRKVTIKEKPKIAFIEGQGELKRIYLADITQSLSEYYDVERVTIDGKINSLTNHIADSTENLIKNKYKAIIIAKPDSVFNEKDKFIIDQYVMHGGKILWMIDRTFASMDSLQGSATTPAIPLDLNLDDMLFKYGVRVNANLVLDLNALPIPMVTGSIGNQPQQTFLPWYYFPILTPSSKHPIVNNLNAIKTEFVSTIDTLVAPGIRKTVLLTSSKYSRIVNTPTIVNLEILRQDPDERQYNMPFLPVAVLLEGSFESVFKNRLTPEVENAPEFGFKENSPATKMIVVGDGDIIKSQLHLSKGYPLPLGYDQYTKESFGNKDFILNCVNYLCDDSGLISTRARELKIRLLDKTRVEKEKLKWQLINTLVPIALIILFGVFQAILRRRKYAK